MTFSYHPEGRIVQGLQPHAKSGGASQPICEGQRQAQQREVSPMVAAVRTGLAMYAGLPC